MTKILFCKNVLQILNKIKTNKIQTKRKYKILNNSKKKIDNKRKKK